MGYIICSWLITIFLLDATLAAPINTLSSAEAGAATTVQA